MTSEGGETRLLLLTLQPKTLADAERMDLEQRLSVGDRRANLEHVRAEDPLFALHEMIRVVLHERHATGQAG